MFESKYLHHLKNFPADSLDDWLLWDWWNRSESMWEVNIFDSVKFESADFEVENFTRAPPFGNPLLLTAGGARLAAKSSPYLRNWLTSHRFGSCNSFGPEFQFALKFLLLFLRYWPKILISWFFHLHCCSCINLSRIETSSMTANVEFFQMGRYFESDMKNRLQIHRTFCVLTFAVPLLKKSFFHKI